ncbi:hypothetical protein JOD14_002068 [Enterococcus lemanii]|jgi:hypothetical protein|nr:hypothetical protein [Enterococcus lemanii]
MFEVKINFQVIKKEEEAISIRNLVANEWIR